MDEFKAMEVKIISRIEKIQTENQLLRKILGKVVEMDKQGVPRDLLYYREQLQLAEGMIYKYGREK